MFTSSGPTSPRYHASDPRFPDPSLIRSEEATSDMDFVFEEGSRAQDSVLKALFSSSPPRSVSLSPGPCDSSCSEPSLLPRGMGRGMGGGVVRVLLSPEEPCVLICITCDGTSCDLQVGRSSGLVVGNQVCTEMQSEGKSVGQINLLLPSEQLSPPPHPPRSGALSAGQALAKHTVCTTLDWPVLSHGKIQTWLTSSSPGLLYLFKPKDSTSTLAFLANNTI